MSIEEYLDKYVEYERKNNTDYTYENAIDTIKQKLLDRQNKKILDFNKNIKYEYDRNGIPKIIHFTLKDKNNIDNPVWKECLEQYRKIYPDYKIMIHDDKDIYNIIAFFNKKKINLFKEIKLGAVKADIFRYLIIYICGGYYSDMDCFPHKRIDNLNTLQYHGNNQNDIFIYNKNTPLTDKAFMFYENPCNNCKLIDNKNKNHNKQPIKYKCLGHNYITNNTNIIVGYEFDKTWCETLVNSKERNSWIHNGVGICQWFFGAKPQEPLFLKCYKESLKNLTKYNFTDKQNLHYNVINSTGPLFFTKIINEYLNKDQTFKDKITILPCDYFCCGSWHNSVPSTKNKFIQHKFTGSWLK